MESERLRIGLTFLVLTIIFIPLHFRILQVLLTQDRFRKLKCFMIMAQVQISVALMIPYYIAMGVSVLSRSSLLGITEALANLNDVAANCSTVLDLILALNRLKLICQLRYPDWVDTALQVAVWIRVLFELGIYMSPWAGFVLSEDFMTMIPDKTLLLGMFCGYLSSGTVIAGSALTLIGYFAIFVYLLYKKRQTKMVKLKIPEKPIFYYALVRFSTDLIINVLFLGIYVVDPTMYNERVYVVLCQIVDSLYMFNFVCIAPLLYLVLNKTMRKAILGREENAVFTLSPRSTGRTPAIKFVDSAN